MPTAVVIGSGPNGLAGALALAQAGLDVVVHEAAEAAGGGLRTAELTLPGVRHDLCSAVHPLGRVSPFFRELELGIDWIDSPVCAAHPFEDGSAAVLERDIGATARLLGADADAYRRLIGPLVGAWREIEPVVVGPYPPTLGVFARLAGALGVARTPAALRHALASADSLARSFTTERARGFVAGHAAHSMLPLERRPSAGFALALIVLGHAVGWPFPRGGAQAIADALVTRLTELGGEVRTSSTVDELPRADVVLADVSPRELLRLARGRFPAGYAQALRRYRHGPGAFKLDWALSAPIPWTADECRRAGTVHLGGTLAEIAASERQAWGGEAAGRPFVLLSQPSLFDDARAPDGVHTAWAYCHVPNGSADDLTERIEMQVERFAPGFRDLVLARSALGPAELEAHNRNLVGGDLNGGAMDLPQLVFRPVRRLVPYRTPLRGVYLCSASTPPGGGVHGMCGFGAARVALRDLGL
ncbi:MAG TPA: NAD(P)/FAD-dependent oxidoreductase [Gaiellaceae bacterium]